MYRVTVAAIIADRVMFYKAGVWGNPVSPSAHPIGECGRARPARGEPGKPGFPIFSPGEWVGAGAARAQGAGETGFPNLLTRREGVGERGPRGGCGRPARVASPRASCPRSQEQGEHARRRPAPREVSGGRSPRPACWFRCAVPAPQRPDVRGGGALRSSASPPAAGALPMGRRAADCRVDPRQRAARGGTSPSQPPPAGGRARRVAPGRTAPQRILIGIIMCRYPSCPTGLNTPGLCGDWVSIASCAVFTTPSRSLR
mgnify:CR=1 FL=1